MVWITVPEPRMEFHPDQQQAYQEKQQARAHTEQIEPSYGQLNTTTSLPASKQP
jgi:hypothetical protein